MSSTEGGDEDRNARSSRRRPSRKGDQSKSTRRSKASASTKSSRRTKSSSRRRSSNEEQDEERQYEMQGAREYTFERGIPAPPVTTRVREKKQRQRSTMVHDNEYYRRDEKEDYERKSAHDSTLKDSLENCVWETMYHLLKTRDELELQQFFESTNDDDEVAFHVFLCKAPAALSLMLLDVLSDHILEILCQARNHGNTALHLFCANLEVIRKPDLILLIRLVDAAPRAVKLPNQQGDTPLHLLVTSRAACNHDDGGESAEQAVAILLEETTDILLLQDSEGATPLHVAVAHQAHTLVIVKLLEVDACQVPDNQGLLPLHYCAATKNMSSLQVIVAAHPHGIAATTVSGDTPLHLFLSNYNENDHDNNKPSRFILKCVKLLTGNGISGGEPILIQNNEKLTPLHCCALFDCHPDITRTIMKHSSASKASLLTNKFGATPLHMAVSQKLQSISMENVIALGTAEAAKAIDRLQRTPLHVAAQNKTHSTSRLVQVLAELCPAATTMTTQRGHLPLHLAAQSQAPAEVVQTLLQLDPHAAQVLNNSSNTPLHNAAKYQADPAVVKLLLETFPDATRVQNHYGNLPLHCATAYQAPPEVIALLLQAFPEGATVQNANQDTPLHYAATYYTSDKEVICRLVEAAPATALLLNSSGQSPIDRARANHASDQIVALLEESAESWTKQSSSKGKFSS